MNFAAALLAISIVAAAVGPVAAAEATITGTVTRVADGDTLTIATSQGPRKIRLNGIDAPERHQPFGEQSRVSLTDLTEGRTIEATCAKVDRFGRDVCKVRRGDLDVGLEQIRRGLAWHFKRYADEQSSSDRAAYAAAEDQARRERRGLWVEQSPQAPWDWRAEHAGATR